jgi:RNA polymerase sigma-70 factor (ECF subfamily)
MADQGRESAEVGAASEFVEGLRNGSRECFESFYESYFARIHDFARRRVRDAAEAEDLTQDIFLAVMGSIDSYQERAHFDSWVFGLARNLVHEHLRRTRRRQARETVAQRGGTPPTPEDELAERRTVETLGRRLAAVEPWQAEAFALRCFEQLPWREVARRTRRTRYAVSRSITHLRGRMAIDLELERDCGKAPGALPEENGGRETDGDRGLF